MADWMAIARFPETIQLDIESAVVLIISSAFAFAAITLQFLTVLRHKGQEAVVDAFTWVLLGAFSALVGALVWQQHGDFFLMLVLEFLAAAAISGYLLSLRYRKLLSDVEEDRKKKSRVPTEHLDAAAGIRDKLRAARLAKGRPVED